MMNKFLLTGATGFLGAFLLDHLLSHSNADIYCLVRAASKEAALQRLQNNAQLYQLKPIDLDRVHIILGNLTKPRCGIADDDYEWLTKNIDAIYHNGAIVNHRLDYEILYASNVQSTQCMIELAMQHTLKPIYFTSTIAVCIALDPITKKLYSFPKEEPVKTPDQLAFGYTKTKWASEQLLLKASERGLPITIFRCGLISGDSRTGIVKNNDILQSLLQCFINAGARADTTSLVINTLPVNEIASVITQISLNKNLHDKIYHLTNPHPLCLNHFFEFAAAHGYPIISLEKNDWIAHCRQYLKNHLRRQPINAALLKLFQATDYGHGFDPYFYPYEFCQTNLTTALRAMNISFTQMDQALLDRYFDYFENSGFLKKQTSLLSSAI